MDLTEFLCFDRIHYYFFEKLEVLRTWCKLNSKDKFLMIRIYLREGEIRDYMLSGYRNNCKLRARVWFIWPLKLMSCGGEEEAFRPRSSVYPPDPSLQIFNGL